MPRVFRAYNESVVLICLAQMHAVYAKADDVDPDSILDCFSTKKAWEGTGGIGGRADKIVTALNIAAKKHPSFVTANLKAGESLTLMCAELRLEMHQFIIKVHEHIDHELRRLPTQGYGEKSCLLLLSNELVALMGRLQEVRLDYPEWTEDCNEWDYLVDYIWTVLKTHMAMRELTSLGLKSHPTITATFMQFLTSQKRNSNVASRISALEHTAKGLENTVETSVAAGKKKVDDTIKIKFDSLYLKSSQLKK